ncbi:MAG: hypothetical protein OEV42_21510, partial [Deltaproteobacteria bacterium]|nr:hypothetical protein [Deltaproteobacteria bacterium]
VQSVADSGSTTEFRYDADGTRVLKRGRYGEVIYVSENYAVRNGAIHTKHVFVGNTRIATKLKLQQVTRSPQKTTTMQTTTTQPATVASSTTTATDQTAQSSTTVQQAQQPVVQETVQFADPPPGNGKAKGRGLAKGKVAATPPGQAAKQTSVIHQQAVSAAPTGGTTDTALPGNSEKGLENALSRGNGRKSGIYRRLGKLGYVVTPGGQIVPDGNLPPGGGGSTPPGGGNGGGNTGGGQGNNTFEEKAVYYYHTDHLGSSNIITDAVGDTYEHMEYFPYGEAWVEETKSEVYFPYKFTGKELDPETGMYYFGARYYEPRISVWVSADPVLSRYLPEDGTNALGLIGMGGVYNAVNLSLYAYTHQNPIKLVDPDGNSATHKLGHDGEYAAFKEALGRKEIPLSAPGRKGGADFITFDEESKTLKYYDNKAYTTGKTVNKVPGLTRDKVNADRVKGGIENLLKEKKITPELAKEINKALTNKNIEKIVTNNAPGSLKPAREGSKLAERGMRFKGVKTTLGVLGIFSIIVESADRNKRAEQNGVSDWDQMMIDYGLRSPPDTNIPRIN